MAESNNLNDRRQMTSSRAGSSRKLLARKALATSAEALQGSEALEDSFPTAEFEEVATPAPDLVNLSATSHFALMPSDAGAPVGAVLNNLPPTTANGSPAPITQNNSTTPVPTPAWSPEDERTFQHLFARRKAAGFQRRGRDVGGQKITLGSIKPNPDTVVAVIVGIVTERDGINRTDLIDAMASAIFPHPKAQPSDKGWCQGYIAGALRNGFLTLAEPKSAVAEAA